MKRISHLLWAAVYWSFHIAVFCPVHVVFHLLHAAFEGLSNACDTVVWHIGTASRNCAMITRCAVYEKSKELVKENQQLRSVNRLLQDQLAADDD